MIKTLLLQQHIFFQLATYVMFPWSVSDLLACVQEFKHLLSFCLLKWKYVKKSKRQAIKISAYVSQRDSRTFSSWPDAPKSG